MKSTPRPWHLQIGQIRVHFGRRRHALAAAHIGGSCARAIVQLWSRSVTCSSARVAPDRRIFAELTLGIQTLYASDHLVRCGPWTGALAMIGKLPGVRQLSDGPGAGELAVCGLSG
jgi:hypothetical protein